ncbi:hypothetical protein VTK26DRAFT_1864 [Humicola hyalothermophila]
MSKYAVNFPTGRPVSQAHAYRAMNASIRPSISSITRALSSSEIPRSTSTCSSTSPTSCPKSIRSRTTLNSPSTSHPSRVVTNSAIFSSPKLRTSCPRAHSHCRTTSFSPSSLSRQPPSPSPPPPPAPAPAPATPSPAPLVLVILTPPDDDDDDDGDNNLLTHLPTSSAPLSSSNRLFTKSPPAPAHRTLASHSPLRRRTHAPRDERVGVWAGPGTS